MEALSSSPRKRSKVIRDGTDEFLMRGSLHEMEIAQAHAGQVATHKAKLNARQSLGRGGSILAIEALHKIKVKTRKDAEEKLRKANAKITRIENKAKEDLRVLGVAARKAEKERRLFIIEHQGILGAYIPPEKWIPIRDPQKDPTPTEREALRANQSLYDELAQVQQEYDTLQLEDPTLFTSIPIDPAILEEEQQFRVQTKRALSAIQLDSDEEDRADSSRSEACKEDDMVSSPPQSVISIDSIAQNADFVNFNDEIYN
jgi:hypothetical protein